MPKKSEKSTNSEQKIWEDIFSYIKRNIFNYTEEQKLSKFLVMRVKGLAYGQHYLRKPTKNHPEPIKQIYSAEAVYWTLVSCTPTILKTFNNAKDENHKVNLLCYIAEQHINEISDRCKNLRKNAEKVEELQTHNLENTSNTLCYKTKTRKKNPLIEEFDTLWGSK